MHQTQISISLPAALTAASSLTHTGLTDESLVIKTAMTEALGGPAVRPYRVVAAHGDSVTVIGYSEHDADALRDRLALANPAAQAAVTVVGSAPMPALQAGTHLRFSLRMVPTVSVTGGKTRDAYLYDCDKAGEGATVDRAESYARYLGARVPGVQFENLSLDGFSLQPMTRRVTGGWRQSRFPVATMSGVLVVTDPELFLPVLAGGVGRMRAYGFGCLRLEAA
jgi:CRISPR-associated protein Cas6/Cse3/CasE subtype I-E